MLRLTLLQHAEVVMAVRRIVANIGTSQIEAARAFYGGIFDMAVVMDHGWIVTLAAATSMNPQISVAAEGGSGAPVPDLSIEVDNLDEVYRRILKAGLTVAYGPTVEPWGVRRFFVKDPFGRLLNVLAHA